MCRKHLVVLCGLSVLVTVIAQENVNTICIKNYSCVHFTQCQDDGNIHYPCNDLQTQVCCPPSSILDSNNPETIATRLLPEQCGTVTIADRITGGQMASIGQFPWMALLGYIQSGLNVPQFLCGGTLITHAYILTAAHCINIDNRLKLAVVRLGELNLETEIDCEQDGMDKTCADKYVDVRVETAIVHEKYDTKTLENDIALIKLHSMISKFTDYIQPICLPVTNDVKYKTTPNDHLTVSGWGKTSSGNIGGSSQLLYANVKLWSFAHCNSTVPTKIRPIKESQICANGARQQDACKGDSGGPLINDTLINGDVRSYQVGIVSFASAQVCGNAELPTIYTKVEYYIEWIVNNIT